MRKNKSRNTAPTELIVIDEGSGYVDAHTWDKIREGLNQRGPFAYPSLIAKLELYHHASKESGGKVILDSHHSFLPVLTGTDGRVIPLYKFVEVIDEITDYDQIKQELPTLSFGQIASGISFLRKLVQFNAKNIDIDAFEDHFQETDPDFQASLRASLEDQEDLRVRTPKL
jgi:hypothetical protein